MNRTQQILEDYLRQANVLNDIHMGGSSPRSPRVEDQQALIDRLDRSRAVNQRILLLVIAVHLITAVFAFWLIYLYRLNFAALKYLLGGSVFALLAIPNGLRSLWREKWTADLLIAVVPNLPPEKALDFIQAFYIGDTSQASGKRR